MRLLLTAGIFSAGLAFAVARKGDASARSKSVLPFSSFQLAANRILEDRFFVRHGVEQTAAAVIDGHGSWHCADFVSKHLPEAVMEKTPRQMGPQQFLKECFERTEELWVEKVRGSYEVGFGKVARSGACCTLSIISDDRVVVANAGDCRTVLVRKTRNGTFESVALSSDHSANIESEQKKLKREHPGEDNIVRCRSKTACYVKGMLMPTRCFGDLYLKRSEFNNKTGDPELGRSVRGGFTPPYITVTPDVRIHSIDTERDVALVMASDGLWDELETGEVGPIVGEAGVPLAAKALVEKAMEIAASKVGLTKEQMLSLPLPRRNMHDDITVVCIGLKPQ